MSQHHASYMFILVFLICLPALVSAEQVTITGQVLGPDDQPVAGAEVWLIRNVFMPLERLLEAEPQTDGEGRFSFPDVEFTPGDSNSALYVAAYQSGLAISWHWLARQTDGLEILLTSPVTVPGQVTTEDGQGLSGVRVQPSEVRQVTLPWPWQGGILRLPDAVGEQLALSTDAQGNFALPGVPPHTRVSAVLFAPGYARVESRPPRDKDKPWIIRYPPAGRIKGHIVCEEEPQQAAEVSIRAHHYRSEFSVDTEVVTDAQGHFELSGLPAGTYKLAVKLGAQSPWQARPQSGIEVTADAPTEVELTLEKATPIRGRVEEEETGTPVAGAVVYLESTSGGYGENTATTDEDGWYLLYALPGTTTVYLGTVPEQYARPDWKDKQVLVDGFAVVGPDFEVKRGVSIQGNVVDNQGRPVKWAQVMYAGRGLGALGRDQVSTDEQGTFTIKQLDPAREVTLFAEAGELMPTGVTTVTPKDQTVPVVLTVHPDVGVTLTGTVVDDEGQPIQDAEVIIHWKGPEWGRYVAHPRTDAQGRFDSKPQWPLYSYHAQASAPGHASGQSERWAAMPGQAHEFAPIVLIAARGVVTGRVMDAAGQPVADAQVYNRGDGPEEASTTTDAEGQFRLAGLYEGPVWVFAEADGHQFGGVATEASAESLLITLRPPDETLQLGPPLPMPPSIDVAKDQEVALQLITEALEIMAEQGGGDEYIRKDLISRLALVDTRQALARSAAAGGYYDGAIYRALAKYLIYDDPDQALSYMYRIGDPFSQLELLRWAAKQLTATDPERAREILNYLIGESLAYQHSRARPFLLSYMAEVLWEIDPEAATPYLRRAAEMAEQLPYDRMGMNARGFVAVALSHIDLPAALEMLGSLRHVSSEMTEDIPDLVYGIALRVAARAPAKAEELFNSVGGPTPPADILPAFCYEMAAVDPDRALRLARGLKDPSGYAGLKAIALGGIAHALAPIDPQQAVNLIQEATQYLSDQRSSPEYRRQYPRLATSCAVLAQIAAEIGYPQVDELVLRALSLRSGQAAPYAPEFRAEENARLAMRLAFVAPETARRLLERCPAEPSQARPSYMYLVNAFTAAAIIDPDLAADMLHQLPPDDSEDQRPHKLEAYQTVINYLTTHPSRRRIEVMDRYGLWLPGAEH